MNSVSNPTRGRLKSEIDVKGCEEIAGEMGLDKKCDLGREVGRSRERRRPQVNILGLLIQYEGGELLFLSIWRRFGRIGQSEEANIEK